MNDLATSQRRRRLGAPGVLALPRVIAVTVAALTSLGGCGAASGRSTMVERIGGAPRVRSFASATAYEAFLRAELALRRGAPELAVRQLELARLGDPNDPYLLARHAEALALAGDREGAETVAREGTTRFATAAAPWLVLASLRAQAGDRAGATVAWSRALECAPDDPEVRADVARGQGADPAAIAHARESAPTARPGDRVLAGRERAQHTGVAPLGTRAVRRFLAAQAWARGEWSMVDRLLTPMVEDDPSAVVERVRVIEARVYDGRPGDAARLVAGLVVRDHPRGASTLGGVTLAERARLWRLAGRPAVAAEEARLAYETDGSDSLAQWVLGASLAEERESAARGVSLLAAIPPSSPHFVDARIDAARALELAGLHLEADDVLARAVALLASDDGVGRDRLRLARATRRIARGRSTEATELLAQVESDAGRQGRGMLLALVAPATSEVDLRARSGDALLDGRADATRVALCLMHRVRCDRDEVTRLLAAARESAPSALETLRARALASTDRDESTALLREAAERDPLSPWVRALAPRAHTMHE